MKSNRVLLLIGFLLYVSSFFLLAVAPTGTSDASGVPGYICAAITLITPLSSDGWRLLQISPMQYVSMLISGLINPLFLITVFLLLIRRGWGFVRVARFTLPVMFVFCWVVFHYEHLHPRGGHFLWMGSVLLAAFSGVFARTSKMSAAPAR